MIFKIDGSLPLINLVHLANIMDGAFFVATVQYILAQIELFFHLNSLVDYQRLILLGAKIHELPLAQDVAQGSVFEEESLNI
jgi:hypothetical protein